MRIAGTQRKGHEVAAICKARREPKAANTLGLPACTTVESTFLMSGMLCDSTDRLVQCAYAEIANYPNLGMCPLLCVIAVRNMIMSPNMFPTQEMFPKLYIYYLT